MECELTREFKAPIAIIKCKSITIWAGLLPIVFTPEIYVDVIISVEGKVKMQATIVNWDYAWKVGFSYNNGKFASISENASKPAKYLDVDNTFDRYTMSAKVKAELKFSGKCRVYGTAAIGLFAGPYAERKVKKESTEPNPKETFKCGLEFGAEADIKIFTTKIAEWKLTFGAIEWLIWEKEWEITDETDKGVVIKGVRWATCNVGEPGTFAATPESYGMFYQWNRKKAWPATGSVSGWNSSASSSSIWEKSNDPCPNGWRVPNIAEMEQLNYAGARTTSRNGVVGMIYGTEPNTIFLPYAGARNNTNGTLINKGSFYYSWGRDRAALGSPAVMYNNEYGYPCVGGVNGGYGFSVRCVAE